MARAAVYLCLALAVLAVFGDSAAATKIKGKGKAVWGKGKGVSFTTECQEVCKPVCRFVPKPVCGEVSVPYQDCDKVPVTTSVKRCGKVCEKPQIVAPVAPVVPYGKGAPVHAFGKKGRHLLHKGKGMPVLAHGKGLAIAPISCDTVCTDVPVTRFQVQCETKVRTVTQCKKEVEQVCSNVCRPVCVKVPVFVQPEPVFVQPVGKGVALPAFGKGKGKFGHHGH